jgi:hypothetical protein
MIETTKGKQNLSFIPSLEGITSSRVLLGVQRDRAPLPGVWGCPPIHYSPPRVWARGLREGSEKDHHERFVLRNA